MTDDIFLTLSLLLMGALLARFVASLLRIPEILLLVAVGALFGPSALDVVDVPFDSLGAQLIFTLGVSLILFYGGLSLSLPILRKVWLSLDAARRAGRGHHRADRGRHRALRLRPPLERRASWSARCCRPRTRRS